MSNHLWSPIKTQTLLEDWNLSFVVATQIKLIKKNYFGKNSKNQNDYIELYQTTTNSKKNVYVCDDDNNRIK